MHAVNCIGYLYVYVKALPRMLYVTRHVAEMLIKHEAKPSVLLASRPRAKCLISRIARARQCCYYFKEFPEKRFDKNVFASLL